MSAEVGGDGGKGSMQDNLSRRRGGGGDRGSHTYNARPLGGTQPRGVMGILLIDTRNAFNEENRTAML